MRRMYVAALVLALLAMSASTALAQPTILPNGVPTITLSRGTGFSGNDPMSIAYNPVFNQYYGGNGGSQTFSAFVWSATGALLQTQTPSNVDLRSFNYNPNTNAIECVTFNAIAGGSPAGLVTMGLNGSGLFTGSNTNTLSTLSGLSDDQTMPSYNSGANRLYSRGTTNVVNVADRATGNLITTTTLNLVPAGSPTLQGEFVGFDSFFDVFVTLDATNDRALVHDINGNFLGASQLSGFNPTQNRFDVGYANDQIFIFDQSLNAYRGFQIFTTGVPEPSTVLLIGSAAAVGAVWQFRRIRRQKERLA